MFIICLQRGLCDDHICPLSYPPSSSSINLMHFGRQASASFFSPSHPLPNPLAPNCIFARLHHLLVLVCVPSFYLTCVPRYCPGSCLAFDFVLPFNGDHHGQTQSSVYCFLFFLTQQFLIHKHRVAAALVNRSH